MLILRSFILVTIIMLHAENAFACSSNAGDTWVLKDDRGWHSEWIRVCSKHGAVENPNASFRGETAKQGEEPIQSELVIKISDTGKVTITRKDRTGTGSDYKQTCVYEGYVWEDAKSDAEPNSFFFPAPRIVGGTYKCTSMKTAGYWTGTIKF